MKALIYCRMSKDRAGAGLGIERQREDCEQLAQALGWDVAGTYADNDISAYSGKPRPQYVALLDALERGEASAVIAWHTDRLHRSPAELEMFIDLCDRRSVVVRTVQAGELDLSTPAGKMTARIVGAVARHEIDHARKRMTAAHKQAAASGRPHGKIPYGYTAVRDTDGKVVDRVVDAAAAAVIREAADRVLAGESCYSVAKDLTARGIPSPGGSTWRSQHVTTLLQSATLAGLRKHGEVVTQGTWAAILSVQQHHALNVRLSDPDRRTNRGTVARHLLSGIAVCGVCGDGVHRGKSHGRDVYWCSSPSRCVSRPLDQVDHWVTSTIIAIAERTDIPTPSPDTSDDQAVLDTLRDRLEALVSQAADGSISPTTLARVEAKLGPQIADAERRARPPRVAPEVQMMWGPNAAQRWDELSLEGKRTLVRTLVTVTILPVGRGRRNVPFSESVKIQKR